MGELGLVVGPRGFGSDDLPEGPRRWLDTIQRHVALEPGQVAWAWMTSANWDDLRTAMWELFCFYEVG